MSPYNDESILIMSQYRRGKYFIRPPSFSSNSWTMLHSQSMQSYMKIIPTDVAQHYHIKLHATKR